MLRIRIGARRAEDVDMRKLLCISVFAVAACAVQPIRPTVPTEYSCDSTRIVRDGKSLRVAANDDPTRAPSLSWRDDAGDHFVSWPQAPTDAEAVEFVVPSDPRADATERVYDASPGASRADWRLVHHDACVAHGGYTDALARFARGDSIEELARELSNGDREQARGLVHHAMLALQRRYYDVR
jgi:hypothetical protein